MKRKMVVLALAFMLGLCCKISYGDNYYYYSPPPTINYPIVQVPINPYRTYSTYYIPRIRYEWIPVYKQVLIKKERLYGFSWLRQPEYQTIIEWQFVPVTRY